ncbi:MAG: ATP-binding protein, partial [Pseudomonadota bacterium]
QRWEQRFDRERKARQQAERILEERSRALYAANRALEDAKAGLEDRVAQRTAALQEAIQKLRVEAKKRLAIQEELRAARDSALELADVKTEFLARMSHEIRTPLNAIIGLTSVLLESDINAKQLHRLETIRTSGQMLLRIINDILDMSKIDAGKLELEFAPVDLTTVLQQAFSLFLLDAKAKNIRLHRKNQRLLPTQVVTDGGRIQQIMTNLLSNAIKYSDSGTVTAGLRMHPVDDSEVAESLRLENPEAAGFWQMVEFTVQDEGRGIPAQQLEELFDPFTRVDDGDDSNSASSSGLGLAICKNFAEMMGGSISVESEAGVGSTFSVRIPVWLPNDDQFVSSDQYDVTEISEVHRTRVELLASNENQARLDDYLSMAVNKPLSVLLADDYDVNRMVMQSQLETLGYRADPVANGEEVLRALHARPYDVVLMDIRMPIIDGVEATKRIRARADGHQPYIVAVTASALKGDRERYLANGMDAYLAKPVDIVDLGVVLEAAFEASNSSPSPVSDDKLRDVDLDLIHVESLRTRLGPNLNAMLKKVIPVYLRELPRRLRHLDEAITANDLEAFTRYCHGLKGTSKSVGAVDLAEKCSRLEIAGYQGEQPTRAELLTLKKLAQRTALALQQTLRTL